MANASCNWTNEPLGSLISVTCPMQSANSWSGYLLASAGSTTLGTSTLAQDLLRKRYLGISGSNKVVGALEMQQVSFCDATHLCKIFGSHLRWLVSLSMCLPVTLFVSLYVSA